MGEFKVPNSDTYTVINDKLIAECIQTKRSSHEEDDKKPFNNLKDPREIPEFHEVETLIFSFKNIRVISNLVKLDALTKLQLDNNAITKIENLEYLTNLKHLDLSFNQIEVIEGLSALTKLTNLSLFSNKIEKLQNMDELVNLQCLSLGKNKLADKEEIMYLRRFKNLQLVTLYGNPLCRDREYRGYVLAYLRYLKYLDYRLVNPEEVTEAREHYHEKLIDIEEMEAKQAAEQEKREALAQEQKMLEAANLSGINDLFRDMLENDPDKNNVNAFMYILREPLERLRSRFEELVGEFKQRMLKHVAAKDAEREEFEMHVKAVCDENDRIGKKLIKEFEKKKKKVFSTVKSVETSEQEAIILLEQLRKENEQLNMKLIQMEVDRSEAFRKVLDNFETAFIELRDQTLETITAMFGRLRAEENAYYDEIRAKLTEEMEKFAADPEKINLGDQATKEDRERVLGLLDDKDELNNNFNGSHAAHINTLDTKEEELVQREKKMCADLIENANAIEFNRNRSRISEIWTYIDRNNEDIADEERLFSG